MNRYLKYLTSNDPKRTISKVGLHFRKAIYPLVRRLSGPLTEVEGILEKSEIMPTGPKIFAVTHTYSREDIAWAISLVGEQSYLLTNAWRELLYTSDGWALWVSGIILVDRYDKENRRAAIEKARRVLELGGNVMIFPEAVWNMSENLLVRKLYLGVYRIAAMTGAPVIPISTMMYGNKFYVSIGKALNLSRLDQCAALSELRDSLATMKWEIMEKYGFSTRKNLLNGQAPSDYWQDHIEEYIAKQKVYEREEESHAHFMDKNDIEQMQAFEHLSELIPSKGNAFLFNKRLYPHAIYQAKQKLIEKGT